MAVWEEIVDYTVPSNTTSVTLNNFGTITKDDFIKVIVTSIDGVNATMNLFLTANNLSNHYIQILFGDGTSVSAFRGPDSNGGLIAQHTSIGDTNQSFVYLKLSENGSLNTFSNYNLRISSSLQTRFCYNTSIDTLSNITSLTFNANRTNGLGANSRIQIYRLTAEKVADITVSSNTTQVDITGLNIDKGSEYLLVSDVGDGSGQSFNRINLFINDNISESSYYTQLIQGDGSSADAVRSNHARLTDISTNAVSLGYSHIKLSNIGAFTSQNYFIRNLGSNLRVHNNFNSSTSESISNVSKINIRSIHTNGIATNSRFQLYKLY